MNGHHMPYSQCFERHAMKGADWCGRCGRCGPLMRRCGRPSHEVTLRWSPKLDNVVKYHLNAVNARKPDKTHIAPRVARFLCQVMHTSKSLDSCSDSSSEAKLIFPFRVLTLFATLFDTSVPWGAIAQPSERRRCTRRRGTENKNKNWRITRKQNKCQKRDGFLSRYSGRFRSVLIHLKSSRRRSYEVLLVTMHSRTFLSHPKVICFLLKWRIWMNVKDNRRASCHFPESVLGASCDRNIALRRFAAMPAL